MNVAKRSILIIFAMFAPLFLIASPASAAGACGPGDGALSLPTWYKYVPLKADCSINKDSPKIKNQEGRLVILILMGVFDIVLFLAGFIAVIMVIYAGFRFLTSAGEPQKIAAARTTLLNAIIGLAIAILGSRAIAFIAGTFF